MLNIPFCPHVPTIKQARYLLDFGLESLYGGAAGGGKSDGLLMSALQFVHVPRYAALILRRTFRDLDQPGALMDRAREWFDPTEAKWSEQRHAWRFPSGAIIQFGYLEHEKQKFRYQSSEFQFIGFDELTQFSESQYRYLFTRLRRPDSGPGASALGSVPLRMRGASNPGGEGHEWVKRRFIDSKERSRQFHPATLKDNPHLDQAAYRASLAQLDPVTRAQMERGDWDVRAVGNMFRREWFVSQLLDTSQPGATVRYWDLASTEYNPNAPSRDPDWTAGARLTRLSNGNCVIDDVVRFRKNPADTERAIQLTAEMDGPDVPIWIEQEPGSSGKITVSHYSRNVLPTFEVHGRAPTRDKISMARPWSARASRGEVAIVRGDWMSAFFDEIEAFPSGGHDDMVDAVSGAYDILFRRGQSNINSPTGTKQFTGAPELSTARRRINRR